MLDYDSINVGFDKDGDNYSIVCIRREDSGDYKIVAAYTDADAIELHRIVTEQGYLKGHDAKIREQTIKEFVDRFNKSTIIMGRATGRTFMLKCLNDIAKLMRGEESDGRP